MIDYIKRQWLNHVHWIWVRLEDDAPNDVIHQRLTGLFQSLVFNSVINSIEQK